MGWGELALMYCRIRGGFLADFTTVIPVLKEHSAAYLTNCCLVNSGVWEGGMMTKQYDLNMNSQLFTYGPAVEIGDCV